MHILTLCWLTWMMYVSAVRNITHRVARHIGAIGFPEGSGMGIFFALGVPVDIPDKSVLFSLYFEANYGLPSEWNSSYYSDVSYLKKRSLDRRLAYDILTKKLESHGYSGEVCLQRVICEVAEEPLSGNGVLGDILQILFTPSASQDENLENEFIEAEYAKDCSERYRNCTKSPLDLISHYITADNN